MSKSSQSGFTLMELLITIALVSVVASIAIPGFQDVMRNNRISANTNELIASLTLAKSSSAGSKVVSVCAASGNSCVGGTDWSGGWLVFFEKKSTPNGVYVPSGSNPDVLIEKFDANKKGVTLTADGGSVIFRSMEPQSTREFTIAATGCKKKNKRIVNVTAKATPALRLDDC